MIDEAGVLKLRELARQGRRLVLKTVHTAGAGHIGGPLSAMEILVTLYFNTLRIDPTEPGRADRDRFILSKGHAAIGLYAVLALRGYLPLDELASFDQLGSRLQGHPDMTVLPALDMSTGSLGQGLSVGVGMALGLARRGSPARTFVLLGDGECQEGQVWEAAHVASAYGLDRLIAIVDANGLPQYGWPAAPFGQSGGANWADRFEAFGFATRSIDGHDIWALDQALATEGHHQPLAVIAHTRKGRGVSFAEQDSRWHSRVPTDQELQQALAELEATP